MTDALNKRNIAALHANSKLLNEKIEKARDEIKSLKAQVLDLNNNVQQLRQQVIINATIGAGSGPTRK